MVTRRCIHQGVLIILGKTHTASPAHSWTLDLWLPNMWPYTHVCGPWSTQLAQDSVSSGETSANVYFLFRDVSLIKSMRITFNS